MNQIDRLTIKAKRLAAGGQELCVAVVVQENGSWASLAHLWDGKNPATTEEMAHHTMEEAIGYLHTLSEKYPNRDDITIIICDV